MLLILFLFYFVVKSYNIFENEEFLLNKYFNYFIVVKLK